MGQPAPTERLESDEVALAACAACLDNSISYNAARIGIDAAAIEPTIRQRVDPPVLLVVNGPEEHRSLYRANIPSVVSRLARHQMAIEF